MFNSRFVRLGVMALGVLGLLGVGTPAAQASTYGTFTFTGTATLNDGLGYPCADATTDTLFQKCPQGTLPHSPPGDPLATVTYLPLENNPVPNVSVRVHGGNTRGFSVAHALCANVVTNIDKLDKEEAHPGTCTLSATGLVTGWCGLSQGQGTAFFTDALGQLYLVDFHFNGPGGTLLVTGHLTKLTNPEGDGTGHTSLLVAVVVAVPPTPLDGQSCANKTATTFDLVGAGVYHLINDLPPV